MTTLALRATAVKNSDDLKRTADIRCMLLKLPSTKVFNVEFSDTDARDALNSFKNEYSTAKGVDQQLSTVNKFTSHFTSPNPWILSDEILCQILSDLYFHAPIKHPLRSVLAKVLHKESSKKGEIITKSISNVIIETHSALCESLKQDEFNIGGINAFISSVNGCFENFPEATSAVKSSFPLLIKSTQQFIDTFIKMLENKNGLSPARRSEVFIDLHNAIRFVLSSIQQFQELITDSNTLEPILDQCWAQLLENPSYADSPIDTKINCGILKVNYDRLFGNIFAPREKILTQYEEDENSKSVPVLPKGTFYAIAIVNTMADKDLTDSNFFPALKVIVDRLITVGKEFTIDSCLIMAVTRALVQCSKRLITLMRKAEELPANDIKYLREAMQECLGFVWINVHHSVDCVRYLSKDLLKNLLRLGQEQPQIFGEIVNETINTVKSSSTSENLACLILDYLCQVFTTEYVLNEIPNIQQRILKNLFNDSCWSACYEQLLSKNSEINYDKWCVRWIQPLMQVDASEWKNDFDRLKIIRNMFERALKTKPEAADFILADSEISIEIYLFVLWIMRRSGRKIYAPENYRASADSKVVYAKVHPSDEIRILAFRILIECHKTSSQFPVEDLKEILEFFRYNCNSQNPAIRQQINTTVKRAMARLECGYATAKRSPSDKSTQLCETYQQFLQDLIEFCVNSCLFDGSNFGRRATGLSTLLYAVDTWQKLLPDDSSIYSEKLWIRLQKTLSDSYVVNKDIASDILLLCYKFYPDKTNLIYNLDDLKRFVTTFRPYNVMTAAHYLVFCAFSQSYFDSYYDAVIWCENLLDDGITMAKKSLLQTARYNALYGLVLSIRHLLKRVDFSSISDVMEIEKWRSFFHRMIPKCRELTDVSAPVVNSSAPEGHLPNDLNDVSHYLSITNEEAASGSQIKVTAQMILLCAWRTVRESALLLGEIALNIPVLTSSNPNGLITVEQLLRVGGHFQQLLVETKHRGAFEQSFLGFSNLCLRLWRSHEPQLHSYPIKLVEKIAAIISGEKTENDPNAELDVKKLCATRRSAGVPFMVQGVVTTENQVCSNSALTFCMTTFMDIATTGAVEESRTHSLNILRALFRCAELGEAVSEYISNGIECSMRGYSAPSWSERNSSTLLFSALMIRVFGVPRSKESENLSIKNKMTGRLFFIRYPRLYDFFYVELKSASEAIKRNERPPRLHPLLLLISRLYPSALEGSDSNLKLSTYIPFISTCSSSPELVTRQLSAKSMVALIPSSNVAEQMNLILGEIADNQSINAVHGYLLQILYLLRSTKQQHCDIDVHTLKQFSIKLVQLNLPANNVIGKTYLEILLEILLNDRMYPIDSSLMDPLIEVRNRFVGVSADSNQCGLLTQSYIQKTFSIFNLLISTNLQIDENNPNALPIISSTVLNTQNELLETQLNIQYLLLSQSMEESIASYDFSRYEIELVEFFERNHRISEIILKQLPSINDLYFIIDHPNQFYPFGVIRSYEILSILITPTDAFERHANLKRLTFSELEEIMTAANEEDGVDDVVDCMWKFITAHLSHCQIDSKQITTKQIANIMTHLRNITQCDKSFNLRQTATEVFVTIIRYFKETADLELLTDFAELLLKLLRDDDVYVRNRTSEIVLDLIHGSDKEYQSDKVIPLAAEDHLLEWLDMRFVGVAEEEAWSKWLHLLRLIYDPATEKGDGNIGAGDTADKNLIDVDIFDDTEPNTFEETVYTSYKCFNFLLKHASQMTGDKEREILSEFSTLQHL